MHDLRCGFGSFATARVAVPLLARGTRDPGAARESAGARPLWRLRRGCGATYDVYNDEGVYLGQIVAPRDVLASGFGGGTVFLNRPPEVAIWVGSAF